MGGKGRMGRPKHSSEKGGWENSEKVIQAFFLSGCLGIIKIA